MRLPRLPLMLALALALPLAAQAATPATTAATAATAEVRGPTDLKPGEYLWHPEVSPAGPIVLVVSLDEQRAYVYRNGIAIGLSTISSGKAGHETPTGVFTILQKDKDHKSNLYNSAPMPYMQRLTWDGIALHGGSLPGHPASHGCVRLPQAFAQKLFSATQRGDTVVVADAKSAPMTLAYPAVLAPVNARGQALPETEGASPAKAWWDDAVAPSGQVGILVSLHDQRLYVLRDGVMIGESPLRADALPAFQGTTLFVMGQGFSDTPSPLDTQQRLHQWTAYPLLGQDRAQATPDLLATPSLPMALPADFARQLYQVLVPGTTLLVTSLPAVRPSAAESGLQPVLESEPATPTSKKS
ncbi:L,D-transpeptidase [Stenotrophomonas sp. ZAC14D1_NAIMI4_6]|uniref:L,D-transpeptidase n=1 Tax=unclassified Stenotrophomonas maltophilia group TaxID=2961925 RepID=UPI000D54280D|nr:MULTISPECIES: L,D-transpeptidase [unclassified Stenotrophomonas maltophilia group]AWH36171.1 L,D-transpeptidase [Stenotrophomonas sp. ZAC14D1_NAIMI4_6]AWH40362.1 L,D-transpeptidase [Stenotrophomonas sp. ZAC14D1_NAIMI4_1]